MTVETELPGQGQGETPPGTDESTSLAGEQSASSGTDAADRIKELEDMLSATGRELKETRYRAERAEQANVQNSTRLQAIEENLSEQDRQREEAYIASLPAEQQESERLRRRVARLEAERAPAQQQLTPEQAQADTVRRMHAMTVQACADFGLEEGEAFQWNDPRLDPRSPETYYTSVRKLARKIQSGAEDSTPPQQKPNVWGGETTTVANTKGQPKSSPANVDVAAIAKQAAEEAVRAVTRELQADTGSAPHSARATTPPPSPFAEALPDRSRDPYQRALDGYDNKQGPRATRAKLKAAFDDANAAFGNRAR